MSPWIVWLVHAWPALALTTIALALVGPSRDPKTPRGDAVLVDLSLGLAATGASVFWLRFLSLAWG